MSHGHPAARSSPNLKANILINDNAHACLADFCESMVVSDQPTSLVTYAGEIRWMSPELIDPDRFGFRDGRPTKESDCYALGMVVYEVLSGQAPFAQFREFAVVRNVLEGGRPVRPQGAKGYGSRMSYGGCRSFVGRMNRMADRISTPCSSVWKTSLDHHGSLPLLWTKT